MKTMLAILLSLLLLGSASAFDLGGARPAKPHIVHPASTPDPSRQGGDTFLDAVAISLPYSGTGTTMGYLDDYDEVCPFDSTSPDVVYTMTPAADMIVNIDMLGSVYDTKIYVYDLDLNLVACNDDFYPDYVSKLEAVALSGGVQYYLVVDGYGGDAGEYVLNITEFMPCVLDCLPWAELEGEPPLVDGYVDMFNSGCSSEGGFVFDTFTAPAFCGVSGWYLSSDDSQYRDTDWFELVVGDMGFIEIIGNAERKTYMFELGPQDCNDVAVLQDVVIGPCNEGTIHIQGDPGDTVWFWVGPTSFDGEGEYDYVLQYWPTPTATRATSWSIVKGLFE